PIKKGRSSFIVSGRRTYLDILARPIIKSALKADGSDGVLGYFFDDVNAKVNHRLSDRDRLYLSFYTGTDKFYSRIKEGYNYSDGGTSRYEDRFDAGFGWGNRTAALRWNHVFSPRLFANTTATYSRYRFNTDAEYESKSFENNVVTEEDLNSVRYRSGINDWAAKVDFDFMPNPAHYVRFGAGAILHTFKPGDFRSRLYSAYMGQDTTDTRSDFVEPNIHAAELALYAEDDWKATDRLRLNAGLHLSGFLPSGRAYYSLQPRFNARYLFDRGWSAKASFSTMRQFIHLLTNETIGLPTDLWLPSTQRIRPQDAWQVALGAAKTLGKEYEFSAELYYKEMRNVIAFKEGSGVFQFQGWENRVAQGDGTAYGAEFFVQKKRGQFSGWVGYTLSWSWRQFDDLNFGRRFPYKYDRRHDFEVTGNYRFNKRVSLSATWVYSTGNAVTLGNSRYLGPTPYSGGIYSTNLYENIHTPERNNYRFTANHRLDVGVDFTKKKRRYERTWSFGAYNAYSRKNPFFLYLDSKQVQYPDGTYGSQPVLKQAALFPIVPYFNWSFKF
ncbi:MAG TPA: TonB-dependent receptor, partial [Saprospiraceae bacterium]|nr:TonB-dependent receptor [Saprospiraceae bacterium]